MVASGLGGCCHDGSVSTQSRSLAVEVRFVLRSLLVEHDLVYDHKLVAGLDSG